MITNKEIWDLSLNLSKRKPFSTEQVNLIARETVAKFNIQRITALELRTEKALDRKSVYGH